MAAERIEHMYTTLGDGRPTMVVWYGVLPQQALEPSICTCLGFVHAIYIT